MPNFKNSMLSIQEALILVRDVHSSVQVIYQIYQKYYLKYGVLIAVILVSVLVLNEAFKLLISLCLCVSREYSVVREFVTYRTQRRRNIPERPSVRDDEAQPLATMSTFRYRRNANEE